MAVADSVQVVKGDSAPDRARVRLAELVAALSLGVDLGFGQPMEHVLRQSMISLRLAETLGLGEDDRSVVYYTALMVNVGCHSDAHEQAKWFGDDIALKSHKYDEREPEWGPGHDAIAGQREPTAAPLPSRRRVRRLWSPRHEQHDCPALGPGSPAR